MSVASCPCPRLNLTHLYIAGLLLSVLLEKWSGVGEAFLNTQLCLEQEEKNEAGRKEKGEEESAIDRQANTSQPLSPSLSIVSKC